METNGSKTGAKARRRRETCETTEYARFARRIIKAFGRRVAEGDEIDLVELIAVRDEMDRVIVEGVRGMRENGYSWAYIGRALRISRQAAQMAYGPKIARLDEEAS